MDKNTFFPYTWFIDESESNLTYIRVYGIGEKGENICVRLTDFKPYVYIELPTHIEWNSTKVSLLCKKIVGFMRNQEPVKIELVWKNKLYGVHQNPDGSKKKFPFLFMSVHNVHDYGCLKGFILKKNLVVAGIGAVKLKMHEQDADPILQLTVTRNLPTAGWILFYGKEVHGDDKVTIADKEYIVKHTHLKAVSKDTVGVPKVMGFDIEVNSSDPTRMPRVEKPEDKIFNVSCVFTRDGQEDFDSYIITLGDPIQEMVGENVHIIRCTTERDILVKFVELIREQNPNVIVGYNILNFDIPYMIDRSKTPCNCRNIFDTLSFHKYMHSKVRTIKWSSSAYKNQEFEYLDAEGRLFVDLLPLIRRDYKMDNYRLKTVSEYFLGDSKDPLSHKGIFKCYRIGTKKKLDGTYSNSAKKAISIVSKYCVQDSALVIRLMNKTKTWVGLCEMAKTCQTQMFSLYTQGQQIKVYSQVYKFCFDNNIIVEKDGYITKEGERYVGAYVFPPVPGLYERVVPFDFCFSGDTLVTLSNGTSRRIDSFTEDELVLGFDKKINGFNNFSFINGLQKKGIRETVKVYFQDGSNTVVTPEHKFMLDNGEWCQAKDLKDKYVKAGIQFPEDKKCPLENEWMLKIEGYTLNMKNNKEREKSLAFSRMVGYILSDGSIYESTCKRGYTRKCVEACFGTMFDAMSFKRDINLFSGVDVSIRKRDGDGDKERERKGTTLSITLPADLSKLFHSVEDIVVGKRSTQEMKLPRFVLDDNCPLSIIREFLGGLFGGDGISSTVCSTGDISSIHFKWTTIEKYVKNMKNVFINIQKLLEKNNIYDTSILKPIKIKYSDKNIRPLDYLENPRYDLQINLKIENTSCFMKNIGFRYCINKAVKSYLCGMYLSMKEHTRHQRIQILNRSNDLIEENITNVFSRSKENMTFKDCLNIARKELLQNEPALYEISLSSVCDLTYDRHERKRHSNKPRKYSLHKKKFPTASEYFEETQSNIWFNGYLIKTDDINIPSFRKKVIDVRSYKPVEVFDIEVDQVHNFLADGITVSNCSLYPTTIIAYNIDYSTLVTDESIPDSKCHVFKWSDHYGCNHDPKVQEKISLTKYIDEQKEKIKKLREKRDNRINKAIKQKYVDEINKAVEDLKPYIQQRSELTKKITKKDKVMCAERYYRFLKEPKGVLPTILQNLLDARKNTRKQIKKSFCCVENCKYMAQYGKDKDNVKFCVNHKEDDDELFIDEEKLGDIKTLNNVLDKRQLAFKVSANSVAGPTPIPCRINGVFTYKTIEEISKENWKRINEEQEISDPIDNLEVWSDKGFTKVKFVMRHPTDEPLYVVKTSNGIVRCTKDHSLLRKNGDEVSPKDLKCRDELLHHDLILSENECYELKKEYQYFVKTIIEQRRIFIKDELTTAKIFVLLKNIGIFVNISEIIDVDDTYYGYYCLYNSDNIYSNNEEIISINKDFTQIGSYVYDIETENHHFAAGIGSMIVHNSMYGAMGVRRGYLPFMPGAMVTTYMGRTNIEVVANTITTKYQGELVYGDSVTGDTPILCKINGKIVYRTIDNLPHYGWTRYKNSKEVADPDNIEVWTENGFTKIKNIIRHKTTKEVFRVLTHTGVVDVTEDHGLLDSNANKISPKEINVGSSLLTSELPVYGEYNFTGINKNLAFIMGLFYADGSCETSWSLNNTDRKLLEKCENILNNNFEDLSFKISHDLGLVPIGENVVSFIKIWREMFYDKENHKKVPDEILWSNKEVRQSFLDGTGFVGKFNIESKIGASGMYFLLSSMGYEVGVNIKENLYQLTCTKYSQREKEDIVKKIVSLGKTEQYVYDLETENHHFSAGIGKLIVHNTDCVLATEPVLIKKDGIIDYKTVEELSDGKWNRINPNKEISKAKEGYKIWSDTGFTDIVNVVRCGVKKPLSRVLTHVGVVNCSNEHSLLTEDLKSVKPIDVKIGDKLCISELPLPDDTPDKPLEIDNYTIPKYEYKGLTAELAFVWGLFYIDGSCDKTWIININDNELLTRVFDILKRNETKLTFMINENKIITDKHDGTYRDLFYDNRKYKRVPTIIFNAPFEIRQSFFMGYYSGDGSRKDPSINLSNKGAIGSAGLFYLMRSIGYQVSVNTITDKPEIYKLTGSTLEKNLRYEPNKVKKIIGFEGKDNEYIYDIQTENHHFAAGVGQLVVHNSNYIHFPHLKTAEETWDYCEYVAAEITKLFPPPISLAFEEVIYWTFFILTKKRYMYTSCYRDGKVSGKVGKKGVLLARRDSSLYIRDLYEKIIFKIFNKEPRDEILMYILESFNQLCSNSIAYKQFVVTKSVGDINNMIIEDIEENGKINKTKCKIGNYKVPILPSNKKEKEEQMKKKDASTEEEYYRKCLPAQVQLAEKMKDRGVPVQTGSRLEFLVTDKKNHLGKQYDKLESIDYFMSHSNVLEVDFFYYIKIAINSIDEILNIAYDKDDPNEKYRFKKDFVKEQYNFRFKTRQKVLDKIKSYGEAHVECIE